MARALHNYSNTYLDLLTYLPTLYSSIKVTTSVILMFGIEAVNRALLKGQKDQKVSHAFQPEGRVACYARAETFTEAVASVASIVATLLLINLLRVHLP